MSRDQRKLKKVVDPVAGARGSVSALVLSITDTEPRAPATGSTTFFSSLSV